MCQHIVFLQRQRLSWSACTLFTFNRRGLPLLPFSSFPSASPITTRCLSLPPAPLLFASFLFYPDVAQNPGFDFSGAEFNGEVPDARSFMGGVKYT